MPAPSSNTPENVAVAAAADRDKLALDIQRHRQIHAQVNPQTSRWRAYTAHGTALTIDDYGDPTEALEAAESQILAGEKHQEDTSLRAIVDALQTAKYVPWPVSRSSPSDPALDGTIGWQARQVETGELIGEVFPGWIACGLEIRRMVNGGK